MHGALSPCRAPATDCCNVTHDGLHYPMNHAGYGPSLYTVASTLEAAYLNGTTIF